MGLRMVSVCFNQLFKTNQNITTVNLHIEPQHKMLGFSPQPTYAYNKGLSTAHFYKSFI
jgi:hypothetical protein